MRASFQVVLATILIVGSLALRGAAAEFDDPEWPCIQRRVPELSIGQMWAGTPPAANAVDPDAEALAVRIAPRRVSVEEIAAAAEAALQDVPPEARPEWLTNLFAAILDRINVERGDILSGIARYATRQRMIAEGIDAMNAELVALQQAPEAERNMDRIEERQDALAWERRIYKDRAQSLTYVCETPVLLEQRAFAIARALAALQ